MQAPLDALDLMNRRSLFKLLVAGGFIMLSSRAVFAAIEKLNRTNPEWKKLLRTEQYNILRENGTERPFTSSLLHEKRSGMFHCVGCDLPLFESKTKYDSGTGWPSFFDAIAGHLETRNDFELGIKRTEYHCARCGGHHGHVFDDGPQPTGLRYCSNGAVLTFKPL